MNKQDCWVEFFEDTNYNDKSIVVHGPAEYMNMREMPGADGYDWGDQAGSLRTGPNTWLVAFADENFQDESITIGPNSSIRDLGGMEDEIDSIKILDHAP